MKNSHPVKYVSLTIFSSSFMAINLLIQAQDNIISTCITSEIIKKLKNNVFSSNYNYRVLYTGQSPRVFISYANATVFLSIL